MLELDDLHKSYGEVTALDGVSFTVPRGTIFGFVGTNGAGKSTAMRIVLGVLAADSGRVRWDGQDLDVPTRRRIGYMPEERGLYPKMRAARQLAYLAELHGTSRGDAEKAARYWLDRLGLDERADDAVQTLSLGNQQRVQLAAALVHEPEVLVLDEPFSGLDPVGVDVMAGVLRERVAAGVACVFSSHQLELVEGLCDRVGIIRAGRMEAVGTVRELRQGREGHRLRIDVQGAPEAWADQLAVTVLEDGTKDDVRRTVLDPGDVGEQDVLDAARRAGDVTHFSRVEPTLTDLFRSVVSA